MRIIAERAMGRIALPKTTAVDLFIKCAGGVVRAAERFQRHHEISECPASYVSRLRRPKEKGGMGGRFPASWLGPALDIIEEDNYPMTAAELIRGRIL